MPPPADSFNKEKKLMLVRNHHENNTAFWRKIKNNGWNLTHNSVDFSSVGSIV